MKILVIRFKWIGDVILTSVLCRSLRRSFPDAQIDYLMYQPSAPLFNNHPDISNVIPIDDNERKNPLRYLMLANSIRRTGYDIIIDASATSRSALFSLLSRNTKYRIARYKSKQSFAYSHNLNKRQLVGDKINQRLALLNPLKDDGFTIKLSNKLKLYPTEQERSLLHQRLTDAGVDLQRPIYAFSATAKETYKRWKPAYLKAVAEHCLHNHHAQLILYHGLPHEHADVVQLHKSLGGHASVFSNIKTNGLRELVALLSHCDLFVGHEGGPRHMAHAVGVPSATIFSPHGRLAEWLPGGGKDSLHRSIEWQDISNIKDQLGIDFEVGDQRYFELYHLIKPKHLITVVDEVIGQLRPKSHKQL